MIEFPPRSLMAKNLRVVALESLVCGGAGWSQPPPRGYPIDATSRSDSDAAPLEVTPWSLGFVSVTVHRSGASYFTTVLHSFFALVTSPNPVPSILSL